MPSLNTPQRFVLAGAGVAILIFQLYRFSTDGVEGYGWILSFVVAAILLLPIFGLLPARRAVKVPMAPSNASLDRIARVKKRIDFLTQRAVERADVLHRQLPILMDLPPLQAAEFRNVNELMADSWRQFCIAYSGCLSLMAEWKREARFPKQHEYALARHAIIGEMVKAEASVAGKHGLQDKYNFERSMEFAERDMCEGETAMRKFADNLAANTPDPDVPLITFFMDKVGAPERSRPSLFQGLRRFNKESLERFSSAQV